VTRPTRMVWITPDAMLWCIGTLALRGVLFQAVSRLPLPPLKNRVTHFLREEAERPRQRIG